MLQQEFEERYGKKVTPAEYKDINAIYIAAEGVDKDAFCKEWKSLKGLGKSNIIQGLMLTIDNEVLDRQQWQHTAEQELEAKEQAKCDLEAAIETNRQLAEERDQLKAEHLAMAKALIKGGMEEEAEKIIGRAKIVAIKAMENMPLNQTDLAFIAFTFNK